MKSIRERDRLDDLNSYQILDSNSEIDFDEIVELASTICGTPISLITFVDQDRQWFKARKGIDIAETERRYSFCSHAIENPTQIMVVENTLLDSRFCNNPFVLGEPHIRFYAGIPLVTKNDQALGTLCVIDDKPSELSPEKARVLEILAKRTVRLLELRKENLLQKKEIENKKTELKITLERLTEAQHATKIGSWDWDIVSNSLYWSSEMYRIFGLKKEPGVDILKSWQGAVHSEDLELVKQTLSDGLQGKHNSIQYRVRRGDEIIWVETTGRVQLNEEGKVIHMMGTVQDVTERKLAEDQRQDYVQMLETMLFDISHKIRQPLSKCIALADVLSYEDSSVEQSKEFAEYLKTSAVQFDSCIREMSDFIQTNKVRISN